MNEYVTVILLVVGALVVLGGFAWWVASRPAPTPHAGAPAAREPSDREVDERIYWIDYEAWDEIHGGSR